VAEHPIFEALRSKDANALREILRRLPNAMAARNAEGVSPISFARYAGASECLYLMLAMQPELDVFEAATVGNYERVEWFERQDPSQLYGWSPDGYTPLHLAAFFGHARIAEELLDWGAEASLASRNAMGVTPLNSAAAGRHAAVVELLIAAGADVNARSAGGHTPLHSAAQNGDAATAELLLAAGADPAIRDSDGLKPADMAGAAGYGELAARLRRPR
jgi:ankyrin repeat protein